MDGIRDKEYIVFIIYKKRSHFPTFNQSQQNEIRSETGESVFTVPVIQNKQKISNSQKHVFHYQKKEVKFCGPTPPPYVCLLFFLRKHCNKRDKSFFF